ncbi:MAG: hypothetical protein ACOC5T_09075 [Elusimicrobiota bacterium]
MKNPKLFKKFFQNIRKVVDNILSASPHLASLKLYWGGGNNNWLQKRGWFKSEKVGVPVDERGKPIPWYSYSMIEFLNRRLKSDLRVFEYGAGNSTLWYASKVQTIVSVEHSEDWYSKISVEAPQNVEIVHALDKESYLEQPLKFENFDIVVIDGLERKKCVEFALKSLKEKGVIILDDAHRPEYEEIVRKLSSSGFKQLPFVSIKALGASTWNTSIFYRDKNCLEI